MWWEMRHHVWNWLRLTFPMKNFWRLSKTTSGAQTSCRNQQPFTTLRFVILRDMARQTRTAMLWHLHLSTSALCAQIAEEENIWFITWIGAYWSQIHTQNAHPKIRLVRNITKTGRKMYTLPAEQDEKAYSSGNRRIQSGWPVRTHSQRFSGTTPTVRWFSILSHLPGQVCTIAKSLPSHGNHLRHGR